MKYCRNEAKAYAKNVLKGVWTALPTNFTEDDRLDEVAAVRNFTRLPEPSRAAAEAVA